MLILAGIYYSLCVIGFFKKNSKILAWIMITMMWIIMGLNTYSGDFSNYEWIYINIENRLYWNEFEPLFTLLMFVCHKIGLTFIGFRMVFAFIFLIVLHYTIQKYTENEAEVLALFMVFPYLYFVSVIRAGLSSVIVILALYEIIGENNNRIKFFLLMMVAVLFHYTSILFFSYLLFKEKKYRKVMILSIVVLSLLGFVLYFNGLIYKFASVFTSNKRLLKWFNLSLGNDGNQELRRALYMIIILLIMVLIVYCEYRNQKSNVYSGDLIENFLCLNINMIILLPVFFVTNTIVRILWEVLLANIICFAKADEIISKRKYRRNNMSVMTFVLLISLFLFAFYSNLPYRGTKNDMFEIFRNNILVVSE